MLNYPTILRVLNSDKFVDKTDCFERIIESRFITFQNCEGTGSSLLLKVLACFLDDSIDTKDVFRKLKIAEKEDIFKEVNSYFVLWLDFSDFNAGSYAEAIEYIRDKMSVVYKNYFSCLGFETDISFCYQEEEFALNIIEKNASVADLQKSFRWLLLQLRDSETCRKDRKLALLIDNMVQLEVVATVEGYVSEMREFLEQFLVEDVYRYCDFFLQIGDCTEEKDSWLFNERFLSYLFFCVPSFDVKENHEEFVVDKEKQCDFSMDPPLSKTFDWDAFVAQERERIHQAKKKEEKKKAEYVRWEKRKYAEELSHEIPLFSINLGLRKKSVDKQLPKYAELNALLKRLFMVSYPNIDADRIYRYLLDIDFKKSIITNTHLLKDKLNSLTSSNLRWKEPIVNSSSGCWVQLINSLKDDGLGFQVGPEILKVYACVNNSDIEEVFVDSLKYLLENASGSFGAKVAVVERSDQMCYWISSDDFKCLKAFYEPFTRNMVRSMPFVAYHGMLGISRDFPGIDGSHNSLQAEIISDYFKSVKRVEDIDLENMYNNYIAKWNADNYEEERFVGFKRLTTLSFIVLLDTLDTILSEKDLTESSLLMSGNRKIWRVLANSHCWADLNDQWGKL